MAPHQIIFVVLSFALATICDQITPNTSSELNYDLDLEDIAIINETANNSVSVEADNATLPTLRPIVELSANVTLNETIDVTTATAKMTSTTSAPITRKSLTPSAVEFYAEEFCLCDLKVSVCDVNCCCDPDCSHGDRSAFSQCLPQRGVVEDRRYCFQTDILFVNNTVYKVNKTNDNLFCIQYDNNKDVRFYKNVQPIVDEAEFADLAPKYAPKDQKDTESDSNMKYGDYILTINANGIVGKLSVLSPFMSSRCEYLQPLSYLKDDTSSCNVDLASLKAPFVTQVLKPEFYYKDFWILADHASLDLLNLTSDDPTLFRKSDQSFLVDVQPICYGPDGDIADCKDSAVTANLVTEARYDIYHNGVLGIFAINVSIALIDKKERQFQFASSVKYHWESDAASGFERSGNPGYIHGKPVLAGSASLNADKSNFTIVLDDSPINWLTIMKGGICKVSNETTDRVSVTFADNIQTSCVVKLSYKDFTDKNCFKEPDLHNILAGGDLPDYIGVFGNSNPEELNDWVPLIRGSQKNVWPLKSNSLCFLLHLRIQIAFANVGSLSNPQPKIIGALYRYEQQDLVFDCIGVHCDLDEKKTFEISTSVEFIDVTQPPTDKFASPPVFEARLPTDFFYPILSNANFVTVKLYLVLLAVFIVALLQ